MQNIGPVYVIRSKFKINKMYDVKNQIIVEDNQAC